MLTEEPQVVAQVLLRYLQELPEPLGTHVLYDDFIRIEGKFLTNKYIHYQIYLFLFFTKKKMKQIWMLGLKE